MKTKESPRYMAPSLAAVALLALFLWWANGHLDNYKIQVLNLIAINSILALSLNLIYGFTGMFSLGHAGFMAIGAYVSSLLILPQVQKDMIYIIAHKDEKAAIMRSINEQAGPGTKAGAICFSLPISSVAGLRAREEN